MASFRTWVSAFRLRTLPLAMACILMGSFLAYGSGTFDVATLSLCLMTTILLQILSNLSNDYGDATSGVDNVSRSGPSRTVQSGLISKGQMKAAIKGCAILALISGVVTLVYAFYPNWKWILIFLGLGLCAIIAAMAYTMGKRPYGYQGLGDLFVFLFFGLIGVGGSYFLQTQQFQFNVLLPSVTLGLLSVGVLNVNNIRDISSDKAAGKRSIPVRIGLRNARIYHVLLMSTSTLCALWYGMKSLTGPWAWVFVLVLPVWYMHTRSVVLREPEQLDPMLRQLAMSTLLFVLLFGAGIYISSFTL